MGAWEDEKKKLDGKANSWKNQLGGVIAEIKGGLTKQPAVAGTPQKALGIDRARSPLMEDISQVAKTAGKGMLQGASLLNYGLAGASDYVLGTEFKPGADKAVKQSLGIQETPVEKWKPIGTPPPKTSTPISTPEQPPAIAATTGGISPSPAAQPVGTQPVAAPVKPEGLKRWEDKDGVIHIEGKNLGIKPAETKSDTLEDLYNKIEKDSRANNQGRLGGVGAKLMEEIKSKQLGIEGNAPATEQNKIEREKLKFEVDKFAQTNDMKEPANYLKALRDFAPKTKTVTYDADGNAVTTEVPDLAASAKMLKEVGVEPPKSIAAELAKKQSAAKGAKPKEGEVKALAAGGKAVFTGGKWVVKK